MIRKEKVSDWIENHQVPITLCASFITAVISLTGIVMTTTLTWRSIGKMMFAILLLIILLVSSFFVVKSTISLIRKPLNDEMEKLKSNFKEEKEDLNQN